MLEALGLPLDLKPEAVGEVGDEVGITFAFARTFHPAMRFVGPIRAARHPVRLQHPGLYYILMPYQQLRHFQMLPLLRYLSGRIFF